ncbi:YadA C-terminal domain-containing protein [Citrobacter portucalensis]|uniref:YadA C-terminal domain-containing protein n=1 Tax=Citrobacter portucalensis TaxID=1639133 RepID=UPI0039793A44
MASIPTPRIGERAMLGAAIGQFKDSSALAVGLNVSATESVALRFSVSTATNGDTAAGVGAGIGF